MNNWVCRNHTPNKMTQNYIPKDCEEMLRKVIKRYTINDPASQSSMLAVALADNSYRGDDPRSFNIAIGIEAEISIRNS